MKKIFIFLVVVVLTLAALFYWRFQQNIYSKDVLKLEILAPETCRAGEEIEYALTYKNNGDVRLEEAELIFEFPQGALPSADDVSLRVVKPLEDIYPGAEEIISFKARIFGQQEEILTAKAFLSYRVKGLKPFYESESSHSLRVHDVPITFAFDAPSKVSAEKEINFSLNYFSSLPFPLSDLGIRMEYPSGFEFSGSAPQGIEKNEWQIGVLNQGDGGRIDIRGRIYGDIDERKMFKAQFGLWIKDRFVVLKEVIKGVEIVRPRLMIDQRINGLSDYIANPGELLHYEIVFRNIGNEYFERMFLVAELEGPFDFSSINLAKGRVNFNEGTIFWDWRDIPQLQFLGPGEEGKVEFYIDVKEERGGVVSRDGESYLVNNVSLSQLNEEFRTKINSRLALEQKGYFQNEAFPNEGPLPPQVGQTTSYTIIWEAKNYYNDAQDVVVKATLPQNVELTGQIIPEEEKENFTFDSGSREIIWRIGDLKAGAGFSEPQKSVAFQISFVPAENQIGQLATLINQARIYGRDTFTDTELESAAGAIDSSLPHDETVSQEQGRVAE